MHQISQEISSLPSLGCKHAWGVCGLCLCKQQHSSKAEDHLIHCSLIVSPKKSVSIDYLPQRRCHSIHRRGFCHTPWEADTSMGRHPPLAGRPTLGQTDPLGRPPDNPPPSTGTATAVDRTHRPGMHSCSTLICFNRRNRWK